MKRLYFVLLVSTLFTVATAQRVARSYIPHGAFSMIVSGKELAVLIKLLTIEFWLLMIRGRRCFMIIILQDNFKQRNII